MKTYQKTAVSLAVLAALGSSFAAAAQQANTGANKAEETELI